MLCFVAALLIGAVNEGLAQETKGEAKKAAVSEQAPEKPAKGEAAGKEEKPTSVGAAKTMEALEQLRQATIEWRKELGPKGKVDAETSQELEDRFRSVLEELRLIEREQPRRKPAAAPHPVAKEKEKEWVTEIRALGPGADMRRAAAIEAVQQALNDKSPAMKFAALNALSQTGDIVYDRAPFRPIVVSIVETARGPMLMAALYALYNVGRQPEDLALVQAAYERDPKALEQSISHLLFSFSDGLIEGKSEEIILKLLGSHDRNTVRETLRGLWGAIVTPKLANRLIELADHPNTHHEAIYYGLSTLKQKNEAVIDKLIETLSDPDWINDGQRALWGLGYGIPKEYQLKVATALVELHNSRSDARTRRTCEDLVQRYGGDVMAAKLVRE